MKIYFEDLEKKLVETNLRDLLKHALGKANLEMDNGSFSGENHSWVGIVQRSKKPSEVTINICFNEKGSKIKEVKVFESDIKEIIDNENMNQII